MDKKRVSGALLQNLHLHSTVTFASCVGFVAVHRLAFTVALGREALRFNALLLKVDLY